MMIRVVFCSHTICQNLSMVASNGAYVAINAFNPLPLRNVYESSSFYIDIVSIHISAHFLVEHYFVVSLFELDSAVVDCNVMIRVQGRTSLYRFCFLKSIFGLVNRFLTWPLCWVMRERMRNSISYFLLSRICSKSSSNTPVSNDCKSSFLCTLHILPKRRYK